MKGHELAALRLACLMCLLCLAGCDVGAAWSENRIRGPTALDDMAAAKKEQDRAQEIVRLQTEFDARAAATPHKDAATRKALRDLLAQMSVGHCRTEREEPCVCQEAQSRAEQLASWDDLPTQVLLGRGAYAHSLDPDAYAGGSADREEARHWFTLAAAQGDPVASRSLRWIKEDEALHALRGRCDALVGAEGVRCAEEWRAGDKRLRERSESE